MQHYKVKSPVLFLIFNRPDVTAQVFNQIRQVRPSRLYVAADGPRSEKANESELCTKTKAVLNIDWDCEVKTLYRTQNLGCRMAVSSAVTWFFEQEEEGIILEDDCLPAISFFSFCDSMLEHYRDDSRIRHITGSNLLNLKTEYSYCYSNQTTVWGWAGWRRVWQQYNVYLNQYEVDEVSQQFRKIFSDAHVIEKWVETFTDVKAGKIDTWDYQYAIMNYFNNSLSVMPNINLISNIGFRNDATHTFDPENPHANVPLQELAEIKHPKYILPEREADLKYLLKEFKISEKLVYLKKHNSTRRRFKRWFKSLYKKT